MRAAARGGSDDDDDDAVVSTRGLFHAPSDTSSSSGSSVGRGDGDADADDGAAVGRVAVGTFALVLPPHCGRALRVVQEPARAIGFKVYPAALTLVDYMVSGWGGLGMGGAVGLELGAGVCGLPAIVCARLGALGVVATDLPEVLPLLRENLRTNGGGGGGGGDSAPVVVVGSGGGGGGGDGDDAIGGGSGGGGRCVAAALPWGESVEGVRLAAAAAFGPTPISFVLCADVVYHAHLIEPLLHTLLRLTDVPPAPRILLAYVQRFKRAKRFFKLARRDFDMTMVRTADVVDYDSLAWRAEGDTLELSPRSAYIEECAGQSAAPLKSYIYTLVRRVRAVRG